MAVIVRALEPHEMDSARALRVLPVQERLVAPVMDSLAEADRYAGAIPLGVFASGTLVGFMMGQLIPNGAWAGDYLVWGYLIDSHHQGRGLGRAGMVAAIEGAAAAGAHGVRVACDPKNTIARSLSESLGFVDQGTINENGAQELRLDFSPDQ
jgi:L-amino acid N-acyltransferase YncA